MHAENYNYGSHTGSKTRQAKNTETLSSNGKKSSEREGDEEEKDRGCETGLCVEAKSVHFLLI